ncbi:hypothetical protein K2X92_01905 [Candidatus Gracilibacteria bacterium]|nr:hypothetical protein [Candidatus Gracilibacteria bacterium]
MGIFDEILPKSQSSTKSGSSSGGQDPIKGQPIIISESESIITSNDILETIEKQPEEVIKIEENNSVLIEETPESILNEIDHNNDPVAFFNQVTTADSEKTETVITTSNTEDSASTFFDMMSKDTPIQELDFNNLSSTYVATSFQDTNEYIDHALVGVNTLMENLEKADAKKLAEEDEYTHQKEHFTELAIQAEEEHQKILAEKAHAEKVKAYLEQEKVANDAHTEASVIEEPSMIPSVESTIPETEIIKEQEEVKKETANTLDSNITALLTESSELEGKKEVEESIAA